MGIGFCIKNQADTDCGRLGIFSRDDLIVALIILGKIVPIDKFRSAIFYDNGHEYSYYRGLKDKKGGDNYCFVLGACRTHDYKYEQEDEDKNARQQIPYAESFIVRVRVGLHRKFQVERLVVLPRQTCHSFPNTILLQA